MRKLTNATFTTSNTFNQPSAETLSWGEGED